MSFSAEGSAQYTDLMNRIDPKRDSPHIDTDVIGLSYWMTTATNLENNWSQLFESSQICIIH
jgi:hypothetical protein